MSKEYVSITETPSAIEDLISASERLLTASEEQFAEIKQENWFNRLFDMVTFSQKGSQRLGEQIETLAQAQEIFLQILPRVAAKSETLAKLIVQEQKNIEALSKNDLSLIKLYKSLSEKLENERLGVSQSADILLLPDQDKLMLSGCLRILSKQFNAPSPAQIQYFNTIHKYLRCENQSDICGPKLGERPEETRKQIFRCCVEYVFLHQNTLESLDEAQQFLDYLDLGPKSIREQKNFVLEMFHARGSDGIIEKYDESKTVEGIPNEFELMLNDAPLAEKQEKNTQLDYTEVRNLIGSKFYNIFPGEQAAAKQKNNTARCKKFIQKYAPDVVEKTVIAFAEMPILFTTCGIHFLNSAEKHEFVRYADIDVSRTTVTATTAGRPYGMNLRFKKSDTTTYFAIGNPNAAMDFLLSLANTDTAKADAAIPIEQMTDAAKLSFSKLLRLFAQECNLNWIETMRFAHDLKMSTTAFDQLLVFFHATHSANELDTVIAEFNANIPYPSEEAARIALVQNMVALIQFSTGRCRGISGAERSVISAFAQKLDVDVSVLDAIIPFAQIPYRMLKRDITVKEITAIGKVMATAAAGVGLPVAAVFGSALLFANTWWFMFIPGIGTVLTAGAIGIVAATALIKKHQEKSGDELETAFNEQLKVVKQSYTALYRMTRETKDEKTGAGLGNLVLAAAQKTYPEISEHIILQRNKDDEAARKKQSIQRKSEKITQKKITLSRQCEADGRCELQLHSVVPGSEKNQFRATAQIKYAPVRVADQFAMVEEGDVGDRTIRIIQIGWGDKECQEKDADKVATMVLEGDFSAHELQDSTFLRV